MELATEIAKANQKMRRIVNRNPQRHTGGHCDREINRILRPTQSAEHHQSRKNVGNHGNQTKCDRPQDDDQDRRDDQECQQKVLEQVFQQRGLGVLKQMRLACVDQFWTNVIGVFEFKIVNDLLSDLFNAVTKSDKVNRLGERKSNTHPPTFCVVGKR